MTRKKKPDTETSPETPQALPDKETLEQTTDAAWVRQLVAGIWEFGRDGDELAVMSNEGNWIWRGITGERLARHASELAELAQKMIAAGH
jgi:hypothetical protein